MTSFGYKKIQEYIDNDIIIELRISFQEDIADNNKMYLFEVVLRRNGFCSISFDHFPTWEEILDELYIK